jgi:DNA mismatch endonuclease (patch repair protein)
MDKWSEETRSKMMAKVKNKNTSPELIVRRFLYGAGFRYRLHNKGLPGSPDIVLPKYNTVIFIHGCFWHGHTCNKGKRPTTRIEFWNQKLDKNIERDQQSQTLLKESGWRVITVWECQLKKDDHILDSLRKSILNG